MKVNTVQQEEEGEKEGEKIIHLQQLSQTISYINHFIKGWKGQIKPFQHRK